MPHRGMIFALGHLASAAYLPRRKARKEGLPGARSGAIMKG
jgi:hypothetical protein